VNTYKLLSFDKREVPVGRRNSRRYKLNNFSPLSKERCPQGSYVPILHRGVALEGKVQNNR
jgi:hypothetical protein